MSLASPIQLRLKIDKQLVYQEEAARLGKPLASYLRERLDTGDETLEAITSLRREMMSMRMMIEDKTEKKIPSGSSEIDGSSLLEILLLLRQLCRPEQVKIAQAEVTRLGFSVRQW